MLHPAPKPQARSLRLQQRYWTSSTLEYTPLIPEQSYGDIFGWVDRSESSKGNVCVEPQITALLYGPRVPCRSCAQPGTVSRILRTTRNVRGDAIPCLQPKFWSGSAGQRRRFYLHADNEVVSHNENLRSYLSYSSLSVVPATCFVRVVLEDPGST